MRDTARRAWYQPAHPLLGNDFIRWMTTTDDVSEDFETIVGLLDDEYARRILTATSQEPMTVPELSDRSEAAESTLYRRVEQLTDAGLVTEQTRVRSDGHHDTVYAATLRGCHVTLRDGQFEVELERADRDAADRLQQLWRDF
jgi:DNA-binding transcriptional ArsR family regulator